MTGPADQGDQGEAEGPADMTGPLMDIAAGLTPIYEFAEGQRAELLRRGWSPQIADQAAGTMLLTMLGQAMKAIREAS